MNNLKGEKSSVLQNFFHSYLFITFALFLVSAFNINAQTNLIKPKRLLTPDNISSDKLPNTSLNQPFQENLLASGNLDLNFGNGGKVTTDFGNENTDTGRDVVVQPDGKIVVVGFAGNSISGRDIAFVRYDENGSLDSTFGGDGKVVISINSNSDYCDGIALQPDGKIVASCSSDSRENRVVVRLNSDGTRDSAFGSNGIVSIDLGSPSTDFSDIVIQPDGKIVVSGTTKSGANDVFSVMRFNANGTLDNNFGNGGMVSTSISAISSCSGLTLQLDGKIILVGGTEASSTATTQLALVRYNSDGSLDTTFSGDGKIAANINGGDSSGFEVTVQPDGKILTAGVLFLNNDETFLVLRYNPDGTLDDTFNSNGIVSTNLGGTSERASGLLLKGGRIIATGWTQSGSNVRFAFTTYNNDGTIDQNVGNNGIVITDFTGRNDTSLNSAIQPNGKLLLVGYIQNSAPNGFDFAVARYNPLSAARNNFDFDGDGRADIAVFRPSNSFWWINQDRQSDIVIPFGATNDVIAPADYDGDGKTDVAVFRNGTWYRINSSDGLFVPIPFGLSGDKPVPGDYDGDGKANIAVFRSGVWFIQIDFQTTRFETFGLAMDIPVPADYDGDGKTDIAVFRPSDQTWYLQLSSTGEFRGIKFGLANDKPVPGDYDGDGKDGIAVFRPQDGTWYLLEGTDFSNFSAIQFGALGDTPVVADYDGDGKADIAVWRSRTWYLLQSRNGLDIFNYGIVNDKPIPAAFIR